MGLYGILPGASRKGSVKGGLTDGVGDMREVKQLRGKSSSSRSLIRGQQAPPTIIGSSDLQLRANLGPDFQTPAASWDGLSLPRFFPFQIGSIC